MGLIFTNYKYNHASNALELNLDLKLYYCGTEVCGPGHSWGPGLKDHYKIHYIHSGKGKFYTEQREYDLSKGQAFLICPHVLSSYEADKLMPWSYSWVAFNGLQAEAYLQRANLSAANPLITCSDDESIEQCFAQMLAASNQAVSRDLRLLSTLYLFLGILADEANLSHSSGSIPKTTELYIEKMLDYIEINYSRSISISEIAAYMGLDRKYMTKLFTNAVGMSPQNFLINYRLNKACELMRNPNVSISEIAHSVGYSDPFLFSKMFKKVKGEAPRMFRKGK